MSYETSLAYAPSNIAFIKYMGKADQANNIPSNPSLSFTLNDLCSYVEVRKVKNMKTGVSFVKELPNINVINNAAQLYRPQLSNVEIKRFTHHIDKVKEKSLDVLESFHLGHESEGFLEIRSANTFPLGAGIASSASSFAALTLSLVYTFCSNKEKFLKVYENDLNFRNLIAQISRLGSGSSCRSFFGPWVKWVGEDVFPVKHDFPNLAHFVLLVNKDPKKVSSSQAHQLVKTSPFYQTRLLNMPEKLKQIEDYLKAGDIKNVSAVAWAEFMEMHSLFHTSNQSFSYWKPETLEVLSWIHPSVGVDQSSPIVTMDAGANIHFFIRNEMKELFKEKLQRQFNRFEILEDSTGLGAKIIC